MHHLGTFNLETDRLILRKFKIGDAKDMYNNWASDNEVTKYLSWKTHLNIEETKEIIKSWIENYYKSDFYQWAIILKENNQAIGSISVVENDDSIEMVHIGYCISKKYWNKGITSEAFERIIKFFFEEVKVNRIEAAHNEKNIYSGKVMLKCKLKKEGILRDALKDNSGITDCLIYSILKREYFYK